MQGKQNKTKHLISLWGRFGVRAAASQTPELARSPPCSRGQAPKIRHRAAGNETEGEVGSEAETEVGSETETAR